MPLPTISPSVTARIASTIAQAEGSVPRQGRPRKTVRVRVGGPVSAWESYTVRRDATPEAQELRGYRMTVQPYNYDDCTPRVELYDAPCTEDVLAVVEFQQWRWDLAKYWLGVHARNQPKADDVDGWWQWVADGEAFAAEMASAANVTSGAVERPGSDHVRLANFLERDLRARSGRVFIRDAHVHATANACAPVIDIQGWQRQQPTVSGTRGWRSRKPCRRGGCAWNDPSCQKGQNKRGVWGTVLGFPGFKVWAKLYMATLLETYSFVEVITNGMDAWFRQLQPFVDSGALDVSPEEWRKLQTKFARAKSAATAAGASAAVGAVGGLVAQINVLAGVLVIAYSYVLFGVGLLLKKYGAVGGHACPTAPFLRSLTSQGCDTSRVVGDADLVKTLENMDMLTPDFTLVPKQYRTKAPAPSDPIVIMPPPPLYESPPVKSSGLPVVPIALGVAALGALVFWKTRGA